MNSEQETALIKKSFQSNYSDSTKRSDGEGKYSPLESRKGLKFKGDVTHSGRTGQRLLTSQKLKIY